MFKHLDQVLQGFAYWDRFQYQEALVQLEQALPETLQAAKQWGEPRFRGFLHQLQNEALPQLNSLVSKPKPSVALVQDLLANAQRRISMERYDDAMVRYLRAIDIAVKGRVFSRGMARGDTNTQQVQLENALQHDFQHGHLSTLINQSQRGLLIAGMDTLLKQHSEDFESYVLGNYETLGLCPAPGWPRFA